MKEYCVVSIISNVCGLVYRKNSHAKLIFERFNVEKHRNFIKCQRDYGNLNAPGKKKKVRRMRLRIELGGGSIVIALRLCNTIKIADDLLPKRRMRMIERIAHLYSPRDLPRDFAFRVANEKRVILYKRACIGVPIGLLISSSARTFASSTSASCARVKKVPVSVAARIPTLTNTRCAEYFRHCSNLRAAAIEKSPHSPTRAPAPTIPASRLSHRASSKKAIRHRDYIYCAPSSRPR